MIDLHIHSTCSDGTFTPKQIVQKVIAKGLYGFSLTDHDTVDGIPEILAMDLPDDLKFIPGIEISCDALHREIHVLGYGINYKDQQLKQKAMMIFTPWRFIQKDIQKPRSRRHLTEEKLI